MGRHPDRRPPSVSGGYTPRPSYGESRGLRPSSPGSNKGNGEEEKFIAAVKESEDEEGEEEEEEEEGAGEESSSDRNDLFLRGAEKRNGTEAGERVARTECR